MKPAALQANPIAVAVDRPAADGYRVHTPAGDAGTYETTRPRVATLQNYSGQVDPGARCRRDDDALLVDVGNPIAARADQHLTLDLSAGTSGSDARCRPGHRGSPNGQ